MHELKKTSALILVVEDEAEIAQILAAYLVKAGMQVIHAADGRTALQMHERHQPDLLVLDVQIPAIDGWGVLAAIRQRASTGVIMLTAMDQDIDKLMGLRLGADDYVVKPFNPAEVVARVEAVLRRLAASARENTPKLLRVDQLEIDLVRHEVVVVQGSQRHALTLTLTEFRLLAHMARTPHKVFSRSELSEACLPEGESLERTVDSHLSKLRKKLEAAELKGMLGNVRGVGYRLGSGVCD